MSVIREIVAIAEFVWIVDNTKCPVKAALIAISTVSRSRISHSMIISGSWRRKARKPEAKVKPMGMIDEKDLKENMSFDLL